MAGQVNFRMSDEVQERWTEVKEQVDLKNDDLFEQMLAAFAESRAVKAGGHATELAEIQETLTAAVSQMTAVLAKDEARRKASVTAAEQERAALAGELARAKEETEELHKQVVALTKERDELVRRVEESDKLAELSARIDALAARKEGGAAEAGE